MDKAAIKEKIENIKWSVDYHRKHMEDSQYELGIWQAALKSAKK